MLYNKIKSICEEKKISINQIETELGFAKGSMCKWNYIKPSYDKIQAIANRLDMSIDDLLKEEKNGD